MTHNIEMLEVKEINNPTWEVEGRQFSSPEEAQNFASIEYLRRLFQTHADMGLIDIEAAAQLVLEDFDNVVAVLHRWDRVRRLA